MSRGDFPETSASLLSALRNRPGDPEAWARFVQTYGPRILQWCRRWGLQDADSHDVTQDVLIRLSRRFGTFKYDDKRRFRGWLRRVTHASWYDFMRRRRDWNQGKGGDSTLRPLLSIVAREKTSDLIDGQDQQKSLRQAMDLVQRRVEPRTWQAFWLLNIDRLPGAEAARRLEMRLGSTYAASAKVRRLIREELLDAESVD